MGARVLVAIYQVFLTTLASILDHLKLKLLVHYLANFQKTKPLLGDIYGLQHDNFEGYVVVMDFYFMKKTFQIQFK